VIITHLKALKLFYLILSLALAAAAAMSAPFFCSGACAFGASADLSASSIIRQHFLPGYLLYYNTTMFEPTPLELVHKIIKGQFGLPESFGTDPFHVWYNVLAGV
jgi:hypothetical protein